MKRTRRLVPCAKCAALIRAERTTCLDCYDPALHVSRLIAVTKHGHAAIRTPTYRSWQQMVQRCTNPNNTHYADYGGRGISICNHWRKFENFLADMGERPEGKTLDRHPNNDGNYEPGNCRWATRSEQARNTRVTILLEYEGQIKSIWSWAEENGMKCATLRLRLKRGWTASDALNRPVQKKTKHLQPPRLEHPPLRSLSEVEAEREKN